MTPIEHLKLFLGKNERTSRDMDQFFTAVGYPGYRTDRTAWCAAARGWALIQAGHQDIVRAIPKEHRLLARSWDMYEDRLRPKGVVRLGGAEVIREGRAQYGDVITYTRGGTTRNRRVQAAGHTDFFTRLEGDRVFGIGGNESNTVRNGSSSINTVLSVWRLPQPTIGGLPSTPLLEHISQDKFREYVDHVLDHEGGFVIDKGGPTFRGVTLSTFRQLGGNPNATVADLRRMTDDEAIEIYRKGYWNTISGDLLPRGLDYATLDFGINSGPWRASVELQRIVGVEDDGEIGPITLAAIRANGDPGRLAAALCDRRLEFMRGLSNWERNKNGWKRRVKEVRERALVLAQTHVDSTAPKGSSDMKDKILNFLKRGVGMLGSKGGIAAALLGQLINVTGTASGADPTVTEPITGMSAQLSTLINALTAAIAAAAIGKDSVPPPTDEPQPAPVDDEAEIRSAMDKIRNGQAAANIIGTIGEISARVLTAGSKESRANLILWGATYQKMVDDEANRNPPTSGTDAS